MLLHPEIWGSNSRKYQIMQLMEKWITGDLQLGAGRTIEHGSHRTARIGAVRRVFSQDGRIVGCIIVFGPEFDARVVTDQRKYLNTFLSFALPSTEPALVAASAITVWNRLKRFGSN
ncbi:hypothetical protein Rs2_25101 [Raphanus sativus]|nr:hypothetical protein Rs2_25101 [Raphanus sativus]